MSIQFECRKCNKIIIRDEKKIGVPVKCSICDTVNKTPGIAFQSQASQIQMNTMCKSLKRHNIVLWTFFVLLSISLVSLIVFLLPINDHFLLPLGLLIYAVNFLLTISYCVLFFSALFLRKHLGINPLLTAFWFFFFTPIFLILSIMSYFKLTKQINTLKAAGIREG